MIEEIPMSRQIDAQSYNASHAVERAQLLLCRRQNIHGCNADRLSARACIQFFTEASDEFRLVSNDRKHATEEEKIAGLYSLDISAKRSRRRREFDAKLLQPALRAARLRARVAYHLPECAPPSTCSTSPVT